MPAEIMGPLFKRGCPVQLIFILVIAPIPYKLELIITILIAIHGSQFLVEIMERFKILGFKIFDLQAKGIIQAQGIVNELIVQLHLFNELRQQFVLKSQLGFFKQVVFV